MKSIFKHFIEKIKNERKKYYKTYFIFKLLNLLFFFIFIMFSILYFFNNNKFFLEISIVSACVAVILVISMTIFGFWQEAKNQIFLLASWANIECDQDLDIIAQLSSFPKDEIKYLKKCYMRNYSSYKKQYFLTISKLMSLLFSVFIFYKLKMDHIEFSNNVWQFTFDSLPFLIAVIISLIILSSVNSVMLISLNYFRYSQHQRILDVLNASIEKAEDVED